MLRLNKNKFQLDYADPYLALTSLLVDAATLEHSLLSIYLYAMFSIRDKYEHVRGRLTSTAFQPQPPGHNAVNPPAERKRPTTFLDVTIEEMQHLALVNQLLYELCAAPCLERHTFPHWFEIYPFPLELRSLDRFVAATFTWIEAPALELRPDPDNAFLKDLEEAVNAPYRDALAADRQKSLTDQFRDESGDPLGSLYGKILERLDELRSNPPSFMPKTFAWGVWSDRIDWIRNQGEIDHYRFFRSLFDGTAFGVDDPKLVWGDAKSDLYPSLALPWRSAFAGRGNSIENEDARALAWLSNLIYWTLLCLLDLSYRTNNRKLIYVGIEQMASGLWWLGLELAQKHDTGIPFDVMLVRYNLGRDEPSTLAIIERLVLEARNVAERADVRPLLPTKFDPSLFQRTLDALKPRTG
jgi:hypothetical protein